MVRSLLFAVVLLPVLCLCLGGCLDEKHNPGDLAVFAGIEFVWCPPGWFYMGQLDDGLDHTQLEVPCVFVVFDKGFWMSKFPNGSAWETPVVGLEHNRVVRGASFKYEDYHCQSSVRGISAYNKTAEDQGFRLAKFD